MKIGEDGKHLFGGTTDRQKFTGVWWGKKIKMPEKR